jgi:hypothetical protein
MTLSAASVHSQVSKSRWAKWKQSQSTIPLGRYHTPYLILHRWDWTTNQVQHWDDGYWTRYLGLYLDQRSCQRHFHKAKAKFAVLCHTLKTKVAPPSAKRMVYALCVKSQIRYPAGLAPWTLIQYQELDWIPNALHRQIYGLRRTFLGDLIYAPHSMGGCGEMRISDSAQLQKWSYLQSVSHNNFASTKVVTALIERAQQAPSNSPTHTIQVYSNGVRTWGYDWNVLPPLCLKSSFNFLKLSGGLALSPCTRMDCFCS